MNSTTELPAAPPGNRAALDELYDLGPFALRLRSNVRDFPGRDLFWRRASDGPTPAFRVDAWEEGAAAAGIRLCAHDDSISARRLLRGHYQGHHFGDPVALVSGGGTFDLRGHRLERVLWTYLVKRMLTEYALQHGVVHLKSAAVRFGSRTVLVVGRSEGGKTVFVTQACRLGATYVTNTHGILDHAGRLGGVATSMRVRRRTSRTPDLSQHPAGDDLNASPVDLFDHIELGPAPVSAVLIVNFDAGASRGLRSISPALAEEFLYQYALGPVVYGQRNDVLEACGRDPVAFAEALVSMKGALHDLCARVPSYVLNVDMLDRAQATSVLDAVAGDG